MVSLLLTLLSGVLLLSPMAAAVAADVVPARHGAASYDGPISEEANRAFFERIGQRTPSRLILRSSGGEVAAGIALGNWIHENGIDVEVKDYCLSSCANYLFTAGRRKIIREGAVVAWHGNYIHLELTGLWREDIPKRMERLGEDEATAGAAVKAQVERLVALEQAFFSRVGVDEKLCRVGKQPPYSVPNYYFLSGDAMAGFGVTNLELPPGYERTDVSDFQVSIRYLKL